MQLAALLYGYALSLRDGGGDGEACPSRRSQIVGLCAAVESSTADGTAFLESQIVGLCAAVEEALGADVLVEHGWGPVVANCRALRCR